MKPKKVIEFHVQKSELSGTVTIKLGDDEFIMDRGCALSLANDLQGFVRDWACRHLLDTFDAGSK